MSVTLGVNSEHIWVNCTRTLLGTIIKVFKSSYQTFYVWLDDRDERSWYDIMQVCTTGHQITSMLQSNPNSSQTHCKKCGAETISKCNKCNTNIKGYHHVPRVISLFSTPIPEFCHECGEPYPWQGKLQISNKSENVDSSKVIEHLFSRLPEVIKQLRKRHDSRTTLDVEDEYDLQDLLHSLLKINFDDIRAEEHTPSHAGTSSIMDFLLLDEKTVIETKMTRNTLKNKQLSSELIEDKETYKKHPACEMLYCLVYDPNGYVNNPRGFENDTNERNENFACKVIIVP